MNKAKQQLRSLRLFLGLCSAFILIAPAPISSQSFDPFAELPSGMLCGMEVPGTLELVDSYIDKWGDDISYKLENIIQYNGDIYQCRKAHRSSDANKPPNGDYWERVKLWGENIQYNPDDAVQHKVSVYRCTTAHLSSDANKPPNAVNWEFLTGTPEEELKRQKSPQEAEEIKNTNIIKKIKVDGNLNLEAEPDKGTVHSGNAVIGESPVEIAQAAAVDGDVHLMTADSALQSGSTSTLNTIMPAPQPTWNSESYSTAKENGFIRTTKESLSTFSIDVDTASYSNIRRFINQGQMPPKKAVRIEELINYFSYSYPQPDSEHPFSVSTELGPCPWNDSHKLVRIGLKAREIDKKDLPPSNLVFLIDVSGSMNHPNKLPLLQKSLKLLVRQLGNEDRIAIVVYAGNDRVVLEPTPGSEQQKIIDAVNALRSGGSTHASSGIITAYQLAEQTFMSGGNNRIILASDGDFNVGVTSLEELQKLIEKKRKSGVYLTVLGLGMGNYHDDTMEILADKGNGNYAYIDNLLEAKKVMVKEMSGTLFSLAKDVKIQVEFNPAKVGAYRLIGYENRALAAEDFNDDKKDAGEIGIGHTVTALYELIPVGAEDSPSVDPLKYQQDQKPALPVTNNIYADELMTVKLRYKPLQSEKSILLNTVVKDEKVDQESTGSDFRFAAAVAGYGMLLTESELAGDINWQQVLRLAKAAKGRDEEGYRAEFIRLVESTELLAE